MPIPTSRAGLSRRLSERGFIAANEEADELLAASNGDEERLEALVARRMTGEPLAWITGRVSFCGIDLQVDPGVYVPRWQSERLARRAVECLPTSGTAVDLCTGCGAIARVMMLERPRARVVACDVDARAVACAAKNRVEVYVGDLFAAIPTALTGRVDVVVGVMPYVPTTEFGLLQRDTFTFESRLSYDGGPDGTRMLRRAMQEGRRFLRRGGTLLLELGGGQVELLGDHLSRLGYGDVSLLHDADGDIRGIETTLKS